MPHHSSERRRDKRMGLACPVKVLDDTGQLVAESKTINISDGGVLLSLPVAALPSIGTDLKLEVSLPRFTPNTFMFEHLTSDACVVRHQPMVDDRYAGAALQFDKQMDLAVEA